MVVGIIVGLLEFTDGSYIYHDMEATVILIIALLFFATYNAYINKWGLEKEAEKRRRYSQNWHAQGWLIRAAIVLAIYFNSGLFLMWIAVISGWHCFDLLINLLRGQKWWYSGSVAMFDRYSKLTWAAKGVWLLIGIYFLIW